MYESYARAAVFARETMTRLRREGHSTEDAKRMVGAAINAGEFAVMKGRPTLGESRFKERLDRLPE